ncbi:CapA family protein [Halorubrum sp. CBA1229]|uniref:CapA family protein n=1 Tax=Halorubrum sp. CBA1229 TaxID=1853699 RepID=UPI000F4078F4|nr:CapA family protein [Halorubrum sp. CBA1229]QKY15546.1 CapA family protein [Halorubrum sp. CBA1229]
MRTRRSLLASGVAGLAGVAGCAALPSGRRAGDGANHDGPNAADVDARIGFVGDCMLGRSVTERWVDDDPAGVWGSTLPQLEALDGLVANLECCVSDRGTRWPDKVYYFRSDPSFAIPALEAAGASFVSLANNHVLDFRGPALRDTRTHLRDAAIAHAGAGTDRDAALAPAVFEAGELTVAAFGLTDQAAAFAAAANEPGTAFATLDPRLPATRSLVEGILERARAHDPDLVVASLHWGANWETEPRRVHERFGRWLVDRGVDVVHGHSAHVLQGVEVYRGRPIIYDAGDFVDDYVDYADREGVHNKRSALFELVVRDGTLAELRVEPTAIADEAATLAGPEVAAWVRETVAERSAAFGIAVERTDNRVSIPLAGESAPSAADDTAATRHGGYGAAADTPHTG